MEKHREIVNDLIGDFRCDIIGIRADWFEYFVLYPLHKCLFWAPSFMLNWTYYVHFVLMLKDYHIPKNRIPVYFIQDYELMMNMRGYPLRIKRR